MKTNKKVILSLKLFKEIIVTLKHGRIFVCSGQHMHPTGIDLYNELVYTLEAIEKQEEQNAK